MTKKLTVFEKTIQHFGSKAKLAHSLNLFPQQINNWLEAGYIPFKRGFQIERLTKGAITRQEIWCEAGELSGDEFKE